MTKTKSDIIETILREADSLGLRYKYTGMFLHVVSPSRYPHNWTPIVSLAIGNQIFTNYVKVYTSAELYGDEDKSVLLADPATIPFEEFNQSLLREKLLSLIKRIEQLDSEIDRYNISNSAATLSGELNGYP